MPVSAQVRLSPRRGRTGEPRRKGEEDSEPSPPDSDSVSFETWQSPSGTRPSPPPVMMTRSSGAGVGGMYLVQLYTSNIILFLLVN